MAFAQEMRWWRCGEHPMPHGRRGSLFFISLSKGVGKPCPVPPPSLRPVFRPTWTRMRTPRSKPSAWFVLCLTTRSHPPLLLITQCCLCLVCLYKATSCVWEPFRSPPGSCVSRGRRRTDAAASLHPRRTHWQFHLTFMPCLLRMGCPALLWRRPFFPPPSLRRHPFLPGKMTTAERCPRQTGQFVFPCICVLASRPTPILLFPLSLSSCVGLEPLRLERFLAFLLACFLELLLQLVPFSCRAPSLCMSALQSVLSMVSPPLPPSRLASPRRGFLPCCCDIVCVCARHPSSFFVFFVVLIPIGTTPGESSGYTQVTTSSAIVAPFLYLSFFRFLTPRLLASLLLPPLSARIAHTGQRDAQGEAARVGVYSEHTRASRPCWKRE